MVIRINRLPLRAKNINRRASLVFMGVQRSTSSFRRSLPSKQFSSTPICSQHLFRHGSTRTSSNNFSLVSNQGLYRRPYRRLRVNRHTIILHQFMKFVPSMLQGRRRSNQRPHFISPLNSRLLLRRKRPRSTMFNHRNRTINSRKYRKTRPLATQSSSMFTLRGTTNPLSNTQLRVATIDDHRHSTHTNSHLGKATTSDNRARRRVPYFRGHPICNRCLYAHPGFHTGSHQEQCPTTNHPVM